MPRRWKRSRLTNIVPAFSSTKFAILDIVLNAGLHVQPSTDVQLAIRDRSSLGYAFRAHAAWQISIAGSYDLCLRRSAAEDRCECLKLSTSSAQFFCWRDWLVDYRP